MAEQPDAATIIDQGATYRCGAFSALQWWDAAGYRGVCEASPFWHRILRTADEQQGLSFGQVLGLVMDWSWDLEVPIRLWEDGFCHDFTALQQLARDEWCLLAGVYENPLIDPAHPEWGPARYFHFLDINELIELPNQWGVPVYTVSDPFHKYDGEDGIASVESMHEAIRKNWHPTIVAAVWRFD